MKIEMWEIARVKPYEGNPRKNDGAVDAVAESIKEFGFRVPLVVDCDGVLIAGHTRLKAAQKLGLAKVPVHVAEGLTPEQARAYRIADNKTVELATWDMDLLPIELADLQDAGIDFSLLGFGEDELAELLAPAGTEGMADEDAVPEPPDDPVTQRGELIVLGQHRLLCGDSSSEADVDRLTDGEAIDLVNTDPPYNVKVEPSKGLKKPANWPKGKGFNPRFEVHKGKATGKDATGVLTGAPGRKLANDFLTDEMFDEQLIAWFGNAARALKPGGSFYIWGASSNLGNYPGPLKACGMYFSQCIVWDKQHPVLTRNDFMRAFEICFYGWKEGAGHHFYGPNNATDLWHVKKVNPQSMVHLTEKPVELARLAIEYSSRPGQRVLDLFGGSGSTLIACEMTGRRAYLMEIDPLYCDVIVERWEKFTGKKAERIAANADAEETPATAVAGEGEAV